MDGRIVRFRTDPVPAQPPHGVAHLRPTVVAGVAAFGAFLAATLVARHLPLVGPALDGVLATADAGSTALVLFVALVNGAGRRSCFRGALYAAAEPHRPAVATTIAYVVVTAATGNVALVIAAAVMGALFSLERLSTRGVLSPHADPPDVVDVDDPRPAPLTTRPRRPSCDPPAVRNRVAAAQRTVPPTPLPTER